MDATKNTWDGFWQVVLFLFMVSAVVSCISCSATGKKDIAGLAESLAELCKDLEGVQVDMDGDELDKLDINCAGRVTHRYER